MQVNVFGIDLEVEKRRFNNWPHYDVKYKTAYILRNRPDLDTLEDNEYADAELYNAAVAEYEKVLRKIEAFRFIDPRLRHKGYTLQDVLRMQGLLDEV